MPKLPEAFLMQMKDLIGDEYDAYLDSFSEPRVYGLRVNTLKISPEEFLKISPFELEPIPWTDNGFYYRESDRPAKHPYYYAGLYYLQEPSAMIPASILPVQPGDRVLDTCAAPGGKSTELAAKLQGKGLLFSNDISNSRALALLKNLELFGVRNAVVLTEDLKKMLPAYTGWFDKILIDAPCSGEGMFRKEPAVIKAWEEHGHDFYVGLQKEIVRNALQLLKPGGYMVYSTCTFAPCEDEDIILYMKEICPELTIEDIPGRFEGFSGGMPEKAAVCDEELKKCVRVFPHRLKGEGHFVALLRKGLPEEGEEIAFKEEPDTIKTDPDARDNRNARIKGHDRAGTGRKVSDQKNSGFNTEEARVSEPAEAFLGSLKLDRTGLRIENRKGKIYLTDEALPVLDGLRILRNGLLLGEEKKNRFEPSQALAMALREDDYPFCINLDTDDDRVIRYLKGETLDLTDLTRESGLSLILADHFPLGFGKSDQGRLKNRYLPGWRYLS